MPIYYRNNVTSRFVSSANNLMDLMSKIIDVSYKDIPTNHECLTGGAVFPAKSVT